MQADRKKLMAKFKGEIDRNILLNPENKTYLLANAESLPIKVINVLLEEIMAQNELVSKYSKIAIAENPELVEEIKKKAKTIKRELVKLSEEEEQEDVETELEQKLSNI